MTITIVGLGPGDPQLLTRQAWDVLSSASDIYLRTSKHPTVDGLPVGPTYHTFDDIYDSTADFQDVYEGIVRRLLETADEKDIIYAVPGDPTVAEHTVTRLRSEAKEAGIDVEIVHGLSFIEPALAAVGVDATDGVQLLDALDIALAHHPAINPDHAALIAQLYSQQVASDVKLTLMNQYPDEHEVVVVTGVGTSDPKVSRMPLYEIDRHECDHLTSLFVPPVESDEQTAVSFEGFQETVAHLRAPEGCPWDRAQNHLSLREYLIEETYEVIDAIDREDPQALSEELGDLLLQVVLHTQIAVDEGEFYMSDVIGHINAKLKRRHPHVWGDVDVEGSPDKVRANWEQIKAQERADKGQSAESILDSVPQALPALAQTHKYDRRAAKVGFDWPQIKGVEEKVREEWNEVLAAETPEEQFLEIGDLLFVVAVWARWLGANPEDALRAANRRFYERFTFIEKRARQQGHELTDLTLDQMEAIWQEAKIELKNEKKADG